MSAGAIIPLLALALIIAFIVFAFVQGLRTKPDRDKRDDWPTLTGGGGPYGGGAPPGPNP